MKTFFEKKRSAALNELCSKLKVSFKQIELLHQALTHTSYANESKNTSIQHNERLEFLGDAVLDVIISEYLFTHFPALPEGELTKARAAIVCEASLARAASEIGIGQYLLLGKGEAGTGGRERISILADAFEAIIGAIYMDNGFQGAIQFVLHCFKQELAEVKRGEYIKDYKTVFQEAVQKHCDSKITYRVTSESGPDHNKTFAVLVTVNEVEYGYGTGKSKKEAEQSAAQQALVKLNI
jgi:ribonuclease-3